MAGPESWSAGERRAAILALVVLGLVLLGAVLAALGAVTAAMWLRGAVAVAAVVGALGAAAWTARRG
jgi:hypothetical protein